MSKESKTARASMSAGQAKTEKKVISDEQYIKNLRYDTENGLYVAQEGAKALLREYDKLLAYTKGVEQNALLFKEQLDGAFGRLNPATLES